MDLCGHCGIQSNTHRRRGSGCTTGASEGGLCAHRPTMPRSGEPPRTPPITPSTSKCDVTGPPDVHATLLVVQVHQQPKHKLQVVFGLEIQGHTGDLVKRGKRLPRHTYHTQRLQIRVHVMIPPSWRYSVAICVGEKDRPQRTLASSRETSIVALPSAAQGSLVYASTTGHWNRDLFPGPSKRQISGIIIG